MVILSKRRARVEGPAQKSQFGSSAPQPNPPAEGPPIAQSNAAGASSLHSTHDRSYYIYITASPSRTLYIGVTSNIETRIYQHKTKEYKGFSATYTCDRLVYVETYTNPTTAIAREKQLKGWTRAKKIALIQQTNPTWQDLSEGWYPPTS